MVIDMDRGKTMEQFKGTSTRIAHMEMPIHQKRKGQR